MIIRKRIKAELLQGVIKLPPEIKDDTMLDLTIEVANPAEEKEASGEHVRSSAEIRNLFQSRIRAAGIEQNFVEEVFSLDEIEWQDLNEVKASFEEDGYGVKINQQDNCVRVKILWRYV